MVAMGLNSWVLLLPETDRVRALRSGPAPGVFFNLAHEREKVEADRNMGP